MKRVSLSGVSLSALTQHSRNTSASVGVRFRLQAGVLINTPSEYIAASRLTSVNASVGACHTVSL